MGATPSTCQRNPLRRMADETKLIRLLISNGFMGVAWHDKDHGGNPSENKNIIDEMGP